MPLSMSFYQDQLIALGKTSAALPDAQRLIYVRHGSVTANSAELKKDEYAYISGVLDLEGIGDWSEVWRWELATPNAAPTLLCGTGLHTIPKLSRAITTLAIEPGTEWRFRLDSVTSVAGRVTRVTNTMARAFDASIRGHSTCRTPPISPRNRDRGTSGGNLASIRLWLGIRPQCPPSPFEQWFCQSI